MQKIKNKIPEGDTKVSPFYYEILSLIGLKKYNNVNN
ncbi:hypothetical protein Q428_03565 [Fervidicella metallireducens AeB]|uniref:Uncharacterized protein n=1 Tax=Fervidicella metallireducens AeB TaxID=1403537 RepID=A0A017RXC4_9CLOT|nr:hypothetical protein Q428_03565 [Fervidicella metallireducens AeB]